MKHTSLYRWALCLPVLFFIGLACGRASLPCAVTDSTEATALEQALLTAWWAGDTTVLLPEPTPLDEVEAAYFSLLDAAPELFWVDSRFAYTATRQGVLALTPTYLCAPDALERLRGELESAVGELLAILPPGISDYAAAYALHDALAAVVTYGTGESALGDAGAYTAYGALVEGRAVCRGYAMAYLSLLARAGIAAEYVQSGAMAHGWVRACLDGRWLHIDVTWDDTAPTTHRRFARSDSAMAALGYVDFP